MAKRKKNARRAQPEAEPARAVMPEGTKRGIAIILLFLALFLGSASLLGKAGLFGGIVKRVMDLLFGGGSWFVMLVLFVLMVMLMRARAWRLRGINYIGVVLFLASWLGLAAAQSRGGGGVIGLFVKGSLERLVGFWPTIIILIAFSLIALLLFFEMSLEDFTRHAPRFSLWHRRGQEDEAEENPPESVVPSDAIATPATLEEVSEKEEALGLMARLRRSKTKSPDEFPVTPLERKRKGRVRRAFQFPLDLMDGDQEKPSSGDIEANMERIERTLSQFGIDVSMGEVSVGPTVTQYTFKPAEGVKLSKITSLSADLALSLAAHPIRMEAPIPGKSLVGIEVPNQHVARVTLRSILESREFQRAHSAMSIVLGRDVAGKPWVADIASMPHLLVAGATGSGKSVCLHSIITSLLYQNSPEQLRFVMIDPKRVELKVYNGIPHLMAPVITDIKKTVNALKWAVLEMERRFDLLSAMNKRDIIQYNDETDDLMPYLVVVIDELADLMATAAGEVEGAIIRLSQMARAVGIHLVVATQRPSVNVITGLIKANITSRIAFAVASQIDSRTILDQAGSEKLLGRGDMLFTSAELSKPRRLQGAFLAQSEIKKIISHITEGAAVPEYDERITERLSLGVGGVNLEGEDELFKQARELVVQDRKASSSYLQRRLKVGYARAARLMDLLEQDGVVSPQDGAKPRDVLVARDAAAASSDDAYEEFAETDNGAYDGEDEENEDEK